MTNGDLASALTKIRKAKERGAQAGQEASASLEELRKRIRAGESTGDTISDFVILNLGDSQEHEEKLKDLRGDLQANEGGLVLVVSNYQTLLWRTQPGCFGGGDHYRYDTTLRFGRVKPPYLTFSLTEPRDIMERILGQGPSFGITVDPVVLLKASSQVDSRGFYQLGEEPQIGRENTIDVTLIKYLKNLPTRIPLSSPVEDDFRSPIHGDRESELTGIEVIVGTEAVDNFFATASLFPRYDGHSVSPDPALYTKLRGVLFEEAKLVAYLDERSGARERKRVARVDELTRDLFYHHSFYLDEVTRLEKARRETPERVREMTAAITMLGDVTELAVMDRDHEELLRLALSTERERLQDYARQTRTNLGEGLKLGIHREDRALQLQGYPGLTLHIGQFATGLCLFYKVNLPKD